MGQKSAFQGGGEEGEFSSALKLNSLAPLFVPKIILILCADFLPGDFKICASVQSVHTPLRKI